MALDSAPACPLLVDDIIVSSADLVVNTTIRTAGSVVSVSCRHGYNLEGSAILKCEKGEWDHPTPLCAVPSASPEPEGHSLPERDIIIIAVCCGVVVLILIGLIVCILLYRRLQQTQREKPLHYLRSSRGVYPPYPLSWYMTPGVQSSPSVVSAPPTSLPGFIYPNRARNKYDIVDTGLDEPVFSVMWDPDRMDWHDSFDYTRSKSIPRPKVNHFEQWAVPYPYTD